MIWWALAALTIPAIVRRPFLGCVFLASLLCIVAIDEANPPYETVAFLATFAGIGSLCFLSRDKLAGTFLCAIGAAHGLQVMGLIELYTRQIIGETIFFAGLFAGTVSGSAMRSSNPDGFLVFGGRLRAVFWPMARDGIVSKTGVAK